MDELLRLGLMSGAPMGATDQTMQPAQFTAPEFGIVDPTYLAQLAILNQPMNMQPVATMPVGLLGSGLLDAEGGTPIIGDWRQRQNTGSGDASGLFVTAPNFGGGGGEFGFNPNQDFGYWSGNTPTIDYGIPVSDALVGTVGPGGSISYGVTASPVQSYGPVVGTPLGTLDAGGGGADGGFGFGGVSASDTGDIGFGGGSLGGFADDGAGGGGGSSKIVCTAMNEAYGFGGFRQAIWLRYSAEHMTKAHEAGYHAIFLPLVDAAYKQQSWYSKPLRKALESIARHRTADLRAEMRGTKRDTLGRAYRLILEPLCYAVGKLKGY